ncbi:DUF3168 domain-containing protein [Sandaracinobacteroides saxicola]|nr:DUF3168 domain-containing protein [Sandaracinobacteroides saxicola]
MAASLAVQAMLVAALEADPALAGVGVHDAPPPDAAVPYVTVGPDVARDWGWKGGGGVEHRLTLTLWERGEGVADAKRLLAAVERAVAALEPEQDGFRLLLNRLERGSVRRTGGLWTQGLLEWRMVTVWENGDGD